VKCGHIFSNCMQTLHRHFAIFEVLTLIFG
jgi:hypothetical protein